MPTPHDPVPQIVVQVVLDSAGGVRTQIQGGPPTRPVVNLMMATAWQDLIDLVTKNKGKVGSPIAIAPPGLEVERNPKA